MGISFRNPVPFIGFPSSYISEYFTGAKFEYSLVASIIVLRLFLETRFMNRGIDWLCMKRVSEIGVLIGCV